MTSKSLEIIIGAKNMTARGIAAAKSSFTAFGRAIKGALSDPFNYATEKFKIFRGKIPGLVNFAKQIATGIGIAGAAAAAVGRKVIAEYQGQIQAEAKLKGALEATSYAAGFTSRELVAYASNLQKTVGVSDDAAISAMGLLSTFSNIRGDNFKAATMAIIDMSASMSKAGETSADIESAVKQVGKALNDPIQGMTMLSKAGITFTESQKEQIKTLQESGKLQQAQGLILDELEARFGGVAKAMFDSDVGTKKLSIAWGELQEEIGRVIVEGSSLRGVFDSVSEAVNNLAESGLIELWAQNVQKAISFLLPGLAKVGSAFGWMKEKIAGASAFWGAIAGGAGMDEAISAMDKIPKAVKEERAERLELIKIRRKEKEEKKQSAEEEKKASLAPKLAAEDAKKAEDSKLAKKKEITDKINELSKKQSDYEKSLAKESLESKKSDLEKELEKKQEIANKTIAEIIKEAREGKKVESEKTEESDRIRKLMGKQQRGVRLSRRDQEFMDAFRERERAGQAVGRIKGQISEAEKQLAAMDKQTTELVGIKDQLATYNGQLQQLLTQA